MASIKISELNEKTNLIDNDLVAVVDSVADETKKMTYGNLKTQIINDNFAILQLNINNSRSAIEMMPSGFTASNCVVVSFEVALTQTQYENNQWSTPALSVNETGSGNYYYLPRCVLYNSGGDNLVEVIDDFVAQMSVTRYYKVVLMKVA